MNKQELYAIAIHHSIDNSNVAIEDHLIEESAELIKELCNANRNRESYVIPEMADLFFQMTKYLRINNMSFDDLMDLSIEKTKKLYPGLLDEL